MAVADGNCEPSTINRTLADGNHLPQIIEGREQSVTRDLRYKLEHFERQFSLLKPLKPMLALTKAFFFHIQTAISH